MRWPFLDQPTPFGFAHQGGTEVAPGNTEASFDHAVSLGYLYIETDVQVTSDGVLVVFHDDDMEPITGVAGRIDEFTWAEVSELRVGGEHRIPGFVDIVERFQAVRFNIEPKADSAVQPLIDAIRSMDLIDRVLIASFDDARVRRSRSALGPRIASSPGRLGVVKLVLRAIVWPRGAVDDAAIQIPTSFSIVPLTTRWLIERLHRLDLQVHVWTINDEAAMIDLLDKGVDAIMTDRPSVLREVLRSRGQWPDDYEQPN